MVSDKLDGASFKIFGKMRPKVFINTKKQKFVDKYF